VMHPWCALCRQHVTWALTVNRKWLALDPDPDPEGNQAAYRDHTQRWLTRQLKTGEEPHGWERRYMPHVATCPARKPPPVLPQNVTPISSAPSWRGPKPINPGRPR
jgi:hypothetical protein